ncbi:MAG: phage virion morphogenesis protein [Coleofasciculus sp. C2-GNP5-27]
MATITVEILNNEGVEEDMKELAKRLGDLSPAFDEIGQELQVIVDDAFEEQKDPDGKPWKPLSKTTLNMRLTREENPITSTRLLSDSGRLRRSIRSTFRKRSATVGITGEASVRGAVQQFGNPKNRLLNKPGFPLAPIPARRFLPLDENGNLSLPKEKENMFAEIIVDYLLEGLFS